MTPAIGLPAATPTTLATINLTAGDWDIQGEAWLSPGASLISAGQYAINTVAAAFPGAPALGTSLVITEYPPPGTAGLLVESVGPCRASLASTTTYFLVVQQTGSSSATMSGKLWARRAR